MATPSGARHRDLEQRFVDIERKLQNLAAVSLRRRQLSVTEGDFVVSGGGGLVVKDGGALDVLHANGGEAVYAGPMAGGGYGFLVEDRDGWGMIRAYDQEGYGGWVLLGHETGRPWVDVYASGFSCNAASGVDIHGSGGVTLNTGASSQTQIGLNSSAVFIGHTTTGSAANARIETNGQVGRVTSSLRYKTDVQPAGIDPAKMLAVEGRTWVAKDEADNPDATRHVGFIAEELHDAGLTEFVEYDDEGRPDAIQYDRLTVGLLAVVKDQQAQLDALTARLDTLEAS